jgi:hypothetical protein
MEGKGIISDIDLFSTIKREFAGFCKLITLPMGTGHPHAHALGKLKVLHKLLGRIPLGVFYPDQSMRSGGPINLRNVEFERRPPDPSRCKGFPGVVLTPSRIN